MNKNLLIAKNEIQYLFLRVDARWVRMHIFAKNLKELILQ